MKFLLWLAIIFMVLAWVMRSKKNARQANARDGKPLHAAADTPEAMLQCGQCGVHIPASEAVLHDSGAAFCSEEHHRQRFPC